MKKFIIALLAALLVVGIFTVAMAEEAGGDAEVPTNCNLGKHDFTATVVIYYPDNVCTGTKYEVKVCSICGVRDARENWVKLADPIGHLIEDIQVTTKATCIDPGVMMLKCARCGELVEVKSTQSPVHNWVEAKEAYVAPTCVTEGVKKYVCTWCGLVKDEKVKATGVHKFHLEYCTVTVKGTCTTDGYYTGFCTMCNAKFEGPTANADKDGTNVLKIKARGHDFHDVIVVKQVTCTDDGEIAYKCTHTKGTIEYDPCYYAVDGEKVDHNVTEPNLLTGTVINKYHKLEVKILDSGKDTGYVTFVYKCTNPKCDYVSAQMTNKVAPPTQGTVSQGDPTPVKTGTTTTTNKTTTKTSTNKKGVSIPKTNDNTSNLPYVMIAVAFVGLVALIASKKKVHG